MDIASTRRTLYIAVAAGLLAVTALAASSCSSKSGGTFSSGDDGPGGGNDGAAGTSSGGGSSNGGGSSSGGSGTSSGFNLGDGGGGGGMGTGTCKDGTYAGMYQCSFNYDPGADGGTDAGFNDAGFIITGNISFQLTQDQSSGESFVDKASGSFGGTCCLGLFSLDAGVSGQLNCNSGVFNGMLSNGTYTGFGMNGTFSGPLNSQYNGTSFSFVDGTWNLTVPGQGTCVGIWSANLQ